MINKVSSPVFLLRRIIVIIYSGHIISQGDQTCESIVCRERPSWVPRGIFGDSRHI